MSSIHDFLHGIIDYAGLFPPAKLPLRNAVENYAAYRNWFEKWMLGRFVCGVELVPETVDLMRALQDDEDPRQWGLTLLPRAAASAAEAADMLRDDLAMVDSAVGGVDLEIASDMFEMRLPGDVVAAANADAARDFVLAMLPVVKERAAAQPTKIYFEAPLTGDWKASLAPALDGIAAAGAAWTAAGQPAPGFKMRLGGVEAAAFPTIEAVAAAIAGARDRELAVKATAGLHHPIRHYSDVVEAHMHGFLNVFMAMMLASRHHIDAAQIETVLKDERGSSFRFEEEGCGWNDLWLSVEDIRWQRTQRAIAFGSCSFHEPVEDLQKLGLIPYPPMFS